jgi:trigger factor
MNVVVEELGTCQKKLTIQIPSEEVNKEYQTVIQNLRKNIALPGFRKGKASISTIRRRFWRDINTEVKEHLVETSLKNALMEHKIAPISTPSVDVKGISVAENQPVEYEAEVEFLPTIEITDYKGVEIIKKKAPETSDEDIHQALKALQRQNALYEPWEENHLIAENDSVTVTFHRTLEGKPLGEPVENQSFWLGVDNLLPEFTQNLLGKRKGDHVEFALQYPEDFQDKAVAGKTVWFAVDIVNVEKVVLPELDDEFAKDLEEESLETLKKKIAQNIQAQRERELIADVKNRLLMKIADAHEFDIPPSLIKEQKKQYPDTEDAQILKMLRAGIIVAKIQEIEDITVSDEELDRAIEQLAMQNQVPVAAMKSVLSEQEGSLEKMRSDLRESKTIDFLYEHANVVEEE